MNHLSSFILETGSHYMDQSWTHRDLPTSASPVLRLKACAIMFSLEIHRKCWKHVLQPVLIFLHFLYLTEIFILPFQFDDLSLVRISKPSSWNFVIGRKVFLCLNSSHSISWRLCKTTIVINTLCFKRIHGSKQTFQARSFNEVVGSW